MCDEHAGYPGLIHWMIVAADNRKGIWRQQGWQTTVLVSATKGNIKDRSLWFLAPDFQRWALPQSVIVHPDYCANFFSFLAISARSSEREFSLLQGFLVSHRESQEAYCHWYSMPVVSRYTYKVSWFGASGLDTRSSPSIRWTSLLCCSASESNGRIMRDAVVIVSQ
jgi:hypothetical protein